MQEVGDHKPVRDQLGARPSGHLDVADHDSVRLLGHFTVSRLPGHGTHAVVIVGGDGPSSFAPTGLPPSAPCSPRVGHDLQDAEGTLKGLNSAACLGRRSPGISRRPVEEARTAAGRDT